MGYEWNMSGKKPWDTFLECVPLQFQTQLENSPIHFDDFKQTWMVF